jgi:hypothetical protein
MDDPIRASGDANRPARANPCDPLRTPTDRELAGLSPPMRTALVVALRLRVIAPPFRGAPRDPDDVAATTIRALDRRGLVKVVSRPTDRRVAAILTAAGEHAARRLADLNADR